MGSIFDDWFTPGSEEKSKEKGLLRPSFVKRAPINVDSWFDAGALWDYVKVELQKSRRSGNAKIPLMQITNPGIDEGRAAMETARFFGRERDVVNLEARASWDRVLSPLLDDVEEALNAKKPKELPGKLRFDVADDSSLTLFYMVKP